MVGTVVGMIDGANSWEDQWRSPIYRHISHFDVGLFL